MLPNLSWKKILIILGFVAIVIVAGFLIYYLFFRPAAPEVAVQPLIAPGQLPEAVKGVPPGVVPEEKVAPKLPEAKITKVPSIKEAKPSEIAAGGITRVNDIDYEKNTSIAIDKSGNNLLTYNHETGKFYKLTSSGEKVSLTDRVYKNVENIAWSAPKNEAILEFPDGSNILYNFETDKQITLPKDWTEFNFSSAGDKIAFKDMNAYEENRWIAIANPDGSGQKYLEPIGDKDRDFIINWSPDNKVVALFKGEGTADRTKIFFLGQHEENFKSLLINGFGFEPKWTPDSTRLLYSASNIQTDNKPMLYVVDASGDRTGYNHQSINLNTWANKCAFADNDTAYCAVPKQLPSGADFAPEIANDIPDYIYKVDLKTGVKSFVAEPEYNYTINQLTVSQDGQTLYFTDNYTNAVHAIKLK